MARLSDKSRFTKFRRILHESERELDCIYHLIAPSEVKTKQLVEDMMMQVNYCLNATQDVS